MKKPESSSEYIEKTMRSEERLLAFMKATSDVIYRMSPDWKTMTELYGRGFLADTEEADPQWLDKYIHPKDQAFVWDVINGCIRDKRIFELEHRVLRADGSIGWTNSRAAPLFDEKGDIKEWVGAASDITERKKIEERLAYQAYLLEDVNDAVLATDMDFSITYWNKAAERTYGWTAQEALGQNADALFRTVFIGRDRGEAVRKLMQKKSVEVEVIHTRKDGSQINAITKVSLVYDVHGQAVGTVGVLRDITEHKKIGQALRESEERLKDILEQLPVGVSVFDCNGQYTLSNERTHFYVSEKMPSRHEQDMQQWHAVDQQGHIIPPDRWPGARALRGETVAPGIEMVYTDQSKQKHWTLVSAVPLRAKTGEVIGGISVIEDITERKRAETALRESEEKYRTLYESMERKTEELNAVITAIPDGLILYDKDGNPTYINEITRKIFAQYKVDGAENPEERVEKAQAFMEDGRPLTAETTPLYRTLKTGEVIQDFVVISRRGLCPNAYTSMSCAPIRNSGGEIVGAVAVHTDITERKRAETALRESEEELRNADKSKNDFISVLSHELRNPLAVIAAGISILEISDNKLQTAKAKEIMKRQINQLCKLVDGLLDMTRISQYKIQLKKENINLNDLAANAAKDAEAAFENKGVRFSAEIQEKPILVRADPVRITQSIGNLLHNALKFTPEGGAVLLSLTQEADEAVIAVKDDGMGISPQMLPQLFKPFIQADNSLDRQSNGGLGLGLSIARGIVEMHGGTVGASSAGLGKGSLFTVRLPAAIENIEAQADDKADVSAEAYRVLIIDDSRDLADLSCSLLRMLGHEAFAAYDGTEGIVRAREIRPDIIFCDIGLPGRNGYEVARIIKADEGLNKAFLIALTGYADEASIKRAQENGFDGHLAKPVDMAALQGILGGYKR